MGLKPQPLSQIKKELQLQDREALIQLCLELGRFKRDNKEMLSYLLFDAQDEEQYISALQADMDASFESINTQLQETLQQSHALTMKAFEKSSTVEFPERGALT